MAHTSPRPVRISLPEGHGDTKLLRGVGYRVTFADGTKSPIRRTYREARKDAHEHKQQPDA